MDNQTPTVGRIVLYVPQKDSPEANNQAEVVPAIVVKPWGKEAGAAVNLKVFTDGHADTWRTSIPYSEAKEPNTWHWPPRA